MSKPEDITNLRTLLRNVSRDLQELEEHAPPRVAAELTSAEGHVTLACAGLSRALSLLGDA